ncbi:MAG: hypothetical protein RMI43_00355 [Candidatus Caldarchaeum sp.]|nr:hypothetical protein [Candidatus Caldarchaeum sp.]
MNRIVVASVFLAALAVLVTGLAVVNAVNAAPLHRGGHRWGPPWLNQTQTTTVEMTVEGILTNADWGYIEVKSGDVVTKIAAPKLWQLNGQPITFFKLFAEDKLNIGDNVRVVAVTITVTKPNGATMSITFAKQITDLTTGVDVTAQTPGGPRGPRTTAT